MAAILAHLRAEGFHGGHDALFWFGDLNYRVECTRETALRLLDVDDPLSLLKLDQLTTQMNQGAPPFRGMTEPGGGVLGFRPTYK